MDATYQQQLDAVLESPAPFDALNPEDVDLGLRIKDLNDFQLNKLYVKARDRADELGAELKALGTEIEAFTREFVGRFEEAGESSKTFEDGITIGVSVEPYPSVKNQAELLGWVKEKGMEAMLTLNYQTMASLVKERLEGKVKDALPAGVEVFMKDKLTCKGRKKSDEK